MKTTGLLLIVGMVICFNQQLFASEQIYLNCMPHGYDGTPQITAQVLGSLILDNVSETRIFEAGSMLPDLLGNLAGKVDQRQVNFMLWKSDAEFETLSLPIGFENSATGSRFVGRFFNQSHFSGKLIRERHSLNCTIQSTIPDQG